MCSQDSIAHTNKELPGLSPQQQHAAANRMVIDDPGPDPRYHIIRQFSGPTTKMPRTQSSGSCRLLNINYFQWSLVCNVAAGYFSPIIHLKRVSNKEIWQRIMRVLFKQSVPWLLSA